MGYSEAGDDYLARESPAFMILFVYIGRALNALIGPLGGSAVAMAKCKLRNKNK